MNRELLQTLRESRLQQQPVAICRLAATRGSTPQKAGAMMLVYGDGSQAGTLGGGCVEADVKRQALVALRDQKPLIQRFDLNHDFSWDDGLICGGRMEVLIDPLTRADDFRIGPADYYEQLQELLVRGEAAVEVVRLPVGESESENQGAWSAYLLAEQTADPMQAQDNAPATWTCLAQRRSTVELTSHERTAIAEERMRTVRPSVVQNCALMPLAARCRLVIVGGGHVGLAVGQLAAQLDFDVWAVDDREAFVSAERFPFAQRRLSGDLEQLLPDLEINPQTYCLIVTRGHGHDEQALYYLANRGARYVGLIGSRRKIKLIFEDLLAEGTPAEALEQVYAPVGIDIGSQTVPEIAVSICAELVAHRNCGGRVPGRTPPVRVSAAS